MKKSLMGATVQVDAEATAAHSSRRGGGSKLRQATLMAVRKRNRSEQRDEGSEEQSSSAGTRATATKDSGDFWCFVKYKHNDKRMWVPAGHVVAVDDCSMIPKQVGVVREATDSVPLSLDSTSAVTSEFHEARLRRDIASPNTIHTIHYLGTTFQPWFFAPYHVYYPEFGLSAEEPLRDAYICPFCLTPQPTQRMHERHVSRQCGSNPQPPGREVYKDEHHGVSVYEVDGSEHKLFSTNLSLLSKSFLENKLLGHDISSYYFYVLAVHPSIIEKDYVTASPGMANDAGTKSKATKLASRGKGKGKGAPGKDEGATADQPTTDAAAPSTVDVAAGLRNQRYVAGMYSVEKGVLDHNLACIAVFPCFQQRGYGHFLIDFSYKMAYKKNMVGSPEKPLSDLGQITYDRYWGERILLWGLGLKKTSTAKQLQTVATVQQQQAAQGAAAVFNPYSHLRQVTIQYIAHECGLEEEDVRSTLLRLGLVHLIDRETFKIVFPKQLLDAASLKRNTRRLNVESNLFRK